MKPFKLFFILILLNIEAFSQTNTFPSSGNVGIGTTSPVVPLHVQGTGGTSLFRIGDGTYYTDLKQDGYITTIDASTHFLFNWGNSKIRGEYSGASTIFYLSGTYGAFMNGWGGFNVGTDEKFGFYSHGSSVPYKAIGAIFNDNNNFGLTFTTKHQGTDIEAARFNTSGNLLIGSASDNGSKLQVNGDIYTSTGKLLTGNNKIYDFNSIAFNIDGSAGGQGELAFRRIAGGAGWYYTFYTGGGRVLNIRDYGLSINRNDNTNSSLTDLIVKNSSNNTTAVVDILNSNDVSLFKVQPNGNIGIGTTSPLSKLDIVTGVGDGTTNETNCLRLRSSDVFSNCMLLQMGVNNTGIGGNNNGYGYISSTYWGASDNNPLVLNPKGGPVGIGLTTGVLWPATVNNTVAIRATGPTANNTLMGKLVFAHYGPYGGNSSFIAGVYDKTLFSSGTGMVFHTISGSDISGVDGVERMRISSDGNVGIGTPSPSYKLDINGTARINQADLSVIGNNNQFIKCGGDGSNNSALFGRYSDETVIGSSGTTLPIFLQTLQAKIGGSSPTTESSAILHLSSSSQGFLLPRMSTSQRNAISSPANGLQIYNTTTNTTDYYNGTTWVALSTGSSGWSFDGNTVGVLKKIGTTDNYALPFITNNIERMRIGTNGNIGIGTANINDANYKLFVETGIRTRKVKVDQSNWADYVFHPSYKLQSLTEVEIYIKENQRLKDIPSAKEVAEKGLDLGDNQAALLKKIEELTLYAIDQNKKIEELNKRIEQLEKAGNNK